MALRIVTTSDGRLASVPVMDAVASALERRGTALVLVPSLSRALDLRRSLADAGVGLGVQVTTPAAWARERWDAWGDGRAVADPITSSVLAHEVLSAADRDGGSSLRLSSGLVGILSSLAMRALPWLPLEPDGSVDAQACAQAGLTEAETALIGAAGALRTLLAQHGLISAAEAMQAIPGLLARQGVAMPDVVWAGWSEMRRAERELVCALGQMSESVFVALLRPGPASQQVRTLVTHLGGHIEEGADLQDAPAPVRAEGLRALSEALFLGSGLQVAAPSPVELLLASGPVAEAELIADRALAGAAAEGPGSRVVIAVPDVLRARRSLFEKLAARGATVRIGGSKPLLDCPTGAGFFAFAEAVAELAALDDDWPAPEQGIDGPVPQLGSMDWWPPRALVDFLLLEASGMPRAKVWALDARWRGNRLLTPGQVLDMLRSGRETSAPVARATEELLRGHVGTAAARLLAPLMGNAEAQGEDGREDASAGETVASLQQVMRVAVAVREVGERLGNDPLEPARLADTVRLCRWAAEGTSVDFREEAAGRPGFPRVRLVSAHEAASLEPGAADTLIVCGLTTTESPVGRPDDLEATLDELLGIEPPRDLMAKARARFASLVAVPTEHLVLERALHDSDSKPTYPSVMLSELLAAYGSSALARPEELGLPVTSGVETELAANIARGVPPARLVADEPACEGQLTDLARPYVLVPQEGSLTLLDGKPVLSASQVETYLDCPYKWFSLRRLRLGTVDAGHGGAEMGTFAHRVLEVTHRELLARALEAAEPGSAREELLACLEREPACHVEGSRVSAANLESALGLLDDEMLLHSQHMRMVRNPRPGQQVLVPHSLAEKAQEERLATDLRSVMSYQAGLLAGFEPRYFEWGFGRHGDLVPYAGAYFIGTVDRIDVSPSGDAVIIDYKHKSPSGFAGEYDAIQEGVLEGECIPRRVQSLIYAQVARRAFEGRLRLVGTVYLATKSPHALAGAADEPFVERVFGTVSARRLPHLSVPRTEGGELGMYDLLDRTEALVAEQVERLRSGDIEARPRDKESCQFCPVMHCERRVAR